MALKPANRQYWNQFPKAQLWECVMLSLGMEPKSTSLNTLIIDRRNGTPELYDKFQIAEANITYKQGDPLVSITRGGYSLSDEFNIPKFIEWAKGMGWDVPKEFTGHTPKAAPTGLLGKLRNKGIEQPASSLPAAAPAQAVNTEKPLADRERKSLKRIIGALLAETVSKTDKSKPYRSESKLIEHLEGQYIGYDGLSKANLEKVFRDAKQILKE